MARLGPRVCLAMRSVRYENGMKRCDEKIAVVASWPEPALKFPVRAMRTPKYSRDRHMKMRSLRSLSIRSASACSDSSETFVECECSLSNRNSNASPKPFPAYKYSSSLEKRAGLILVVRRSRVGVMTGALLFSMAMRESEDSARYSSNAVVDSFDRAKYRF